MTISSRSVSSRPVSSRFVQLDALRGLAALFVVFAHHVRVFDQQPGAAPEHVSQVSQVLHALRYTPLFVLWGGHEAVVIFFALSGFVLFLMLQKGGLTRTPVERFAKHFHPSGARRRETGSGRGVGNPASFRVVNETDGTRMSYPQYALRRVLRLYPPYLLAMLVAVGLAVTLGGRSVPGWAGQFWHGPYTPGSVVASLLMVGRFDDQQYDFVVWSLVHEMRVSLLFPLIAWAVLAWRARVTLGVFLGLSLLADALIYLAYHGLPALLPWRSFMETGHYVVIFVVGALIARQYPRLAAWTAARTRAQTWALAAAALASYCYGGAVLPALGLDSNAGDLLIVPGTVLTVLLCAAHPAFQRPLAHPWLQFLGRVSYSLYLTHALVLLTVLHLSTLPLPWSLLLSLSLCVPVAALTYALAEQPSLTLTRRLARSARTTPTAHTTPPAQ
ncbi:acyltransferase family protein [Deinococcus sp. A31D244]|uniref:acyltransferase family protein n=1 Tax=Deinococcus sp. A31D244 TaxID=3397675 RepID=UPI0039E0D9B7